MSRNRIRTKTTGMDCDADANVCGYYCGFGYDHYNAGGEHCSSNSSLDPYDCNVECCGDDLGENYKEMDCGAVLHYDGSTTVGNACVSDNTDACCNSNTDCVYNNNCYTDDGNEETVELTLAGDDLTCSLGHWCPEFFVWNPINEWCEYQPTPCYDPDNPDMCPYDSRTELDLLLKDIKCLRPETTSWNPPYTQVCCIMNEIDGTVFSKWCDIETLGLPEENE